MRIRIFNLCNWFAFPRRRAASEFSRGFQPTGRSENIPASRQRRLNPPRYPEPERVSIVADATQRKIYADRGLKPTAKFRRRSAAEKHSHESQNLMRSSILGPRPSTLSRAFRVLPIFIFAIVIFSPCAFAQIRPISRPAPETQGSRADQLPLSGRSGQTGSVTATQTPTPGTTTSVNTINPTVQTQGPFSGSVWGAARAPFSGRLSLREAVGRGIDFNLGAVGLTNAVAESRGQRKIVRSALLPNVRGYLSETVQQINLAATGFSFDQQLGQLFPGVTIPAVVGPFNYFDLRATLTQ